jgi:RNA polymerase sigma-70 factor, ECF subfamily
VPSKQRLSTVYLKELGIQPTDPTTSDHLELTLVAAIAEAHETYPGCTVDEIAFLHHLVRHVGREALEPGWPRTFRVDDMLLAFASGAGCPNAVKLLRDKTQSVIHAASRKINDSSAFVDEVSQRLFEKLLVSAPDGSPRILAYGGRGAIGAWVRVAAMRVAIDIMRQQRGVNEPADDQVLEELDLTGQDPELEYIRFRYADEVNGALRQAFGVLTARERTILRMHLLDGLNIDSIGVLYRVHRSTVARWIARARDTILEESHTRLQRRLGATDSEVRSLERLVKSDLRVCLSELLASSAGQPHEHSG